jgi:hypothetical protein
VFLTCVAFLEAGCACVCHHGRLLTFFVQFQFLRPYFRRRSGGMEGLFVASGVGMISGVWFFKPLLEEMDQNRIAREARESLEAGNNGTTTASNGKS